MISVNTIPDVPNVLMCRAAAQHLYRLLARYNWCLRDARQFEERWRLFWPTLRWCERAMVRLCLAAQGGLRVGQRLRLDRLGMDVEEGTAHQPVRMSPDVEAEFVNVLGLYYQRLTTRAEIVAMWLEQWPQTMSALHAAGAGSGWFSEPEDFVPWRLFHRARQELSSKGWSAMEAQHAAADLASALHAHLHAKEQSLCG